MPAPMPRDPPVINATLPASSPESTLIASPFAHVIIERELQPGPGMLKPAPLAAANCWSMDVAQALSPADPPLPDYC
jgi:hypothetical protein